MRQSTTVDLPSAVRDVVADGIAKNVVQCFFVGDVERFLLDDDDELGFVVHFGEEVTLGLISLAYGDGIGWGVESGPGFVE